ncbi:hypothetical protein O6H91_Y190100 [Diphasiastrum complanatum]|nr:hypothetical protein O6H91_Y190100 [Diphasiastrum complanatum]
MELQRQVAQAVHILNHDLSSSNRVAANQWLVQFQRSDAAWEVAASILTSESSHIHEYEVELFAAQILKRKATEDCNGSLGVLESSLHNRMKYNIDSNRPPKYAEILFVCI